MSRNRDLGATLFDRLETYGGTLVFRNDRAGALVILSPGSVEEDAGTIVGVIPLAAIGLDGDTLAARGWHMGQRGLEREWALQTAVDRSVIMRDVEDAVDILSARRGLTRANFPLVHVSQFSSDAGYSQVGCVVAVVSALVGNVAGTAILLVLHTDWLIREGDGIETVAAGLVVGWVVAFVVAVVGGVFVGIGLTSLIERVPRLSQSSGEVFLVLMIVVPAALAAITLGLAASVNR